MKILSIIAAVIIFVAAIFFTYQQFKAPAEVVTNPIEVGAVLTEAASAPTPASEPVAAASAAQ